jgi:hypothetical protein
LAKSSKTAGVFKTVDNVRKVMQGIDMLTNTTVLVGVPDDRGGRKEAGPINNAALAYIHDKGSPAAGIPARPFMEPGIAAVQDRINLELRNAGNAALRGGGQSAVTAALNRVGIIATRSIKLKITEGIPPPLAPSTIAARIRRVKGKARRAKIAAARAAGTPDSRIGGIEGLFTPLVVSGQLRNAITYVLRKIKGKGYK